MSQKAVAAVLAGIGLTLLAISGIGFFLLSQNSELREAEGEVRGQAADLVSPADARMASADPVPGAEPNAPDTSPSTFLLSGAGDSGVTQDTHR